MMQKQYNCELSSYKDEQEAKRLLLKNVAKEWKLEKVVTQTGDYSYAISYEFEEGKDICFFVKDDNMLYYCGPVNVRRKKLGAYTLWTFDYFLYLKGRHIIVKDLSYIWDALSLLHMPEELICNPIIVIEKNNLFQLARCRETYLSSDIENVYLMDALPGSDQIGRTYVLNLYVNGALVKRIKNIQKFEPSIIKPNQIFYKNVSDEKYIIYDYTIAERCDVCEYPESHFRMEEWQDFWMLLYWGGVDGKKQFYKMNKKQKQLFTERISLYNEEYFDYYFSTTNMIADAVVNYYFANHAEIIKYPAVFQEDFSHNYRIRIPKNNTELLHLWIYFCIEHMVTEPSICGIEMSSVIRGFKQIETLHDEISEIIHIIDKRISRKRLRFIESLMRKYPYRTLLSANGTSFQYRNSISESAYSYAYDKRDILYQKYNDILLELAVQGKISSRWKSEFSLFMLVKSYFINAIYQYRSDWLQGQSLDIYIPEINLGIEYQGIQHYEAVDVFGGEKGLIETQRRDAIKKKKCKDNNVSLYEWHYSVEVNDWNFVKMLESLKFVVPVKRYAYYPHEAEKEKKDETMVEIICQYDLQGNLLEQYRSVSEASQKNNVQEYMIRRACSGIRKSAGNYQWRKTTKNCMELKISELKQAYSNGKARIVVQMDLEEEIIAQYNSIAEAVRLTGINSKSIRDAATGKQKHAGGYKWKYQE